MCIRDSLGGETADPQADARVHRLVATRRGAHVVAVFGRGARTDDGVVVRKTQEVREGAGAERVRESHLFRLLDGDEIEEARVLRAIVLAARAAVVAALVACVRLT